MTYEALVRFAVGKLGGVVDNGYLHVPSCDSNCGRSYLLAENPLTSPDLFFRGLEVAQNEVTVVIYTDDIHIKKSESVEVFKPFDSVRDIPLTFWQCWAELEGGQG